MIRPALHALARVLAATVQAPRIGLGTDDPMWWARMVCGWVSVEGVGVLVDMGPPEWQHWPWLPAADAFEALVARRLLPERWCDPAAAPRWWHPACGDPAHERVPQSPRDGLTGPVWEDDGCAAPMPSTRDMVAVASLGVAAIERIEATADALLRGSRVLWRPMSAISLDDYHRHASSLGDTPEVAFSLYLAGDLPRRDIPEVATWAQDDMNHAWPAMLALRDLGVHPMDVQRKLFRSGDGPPLVVIGVERFRKASGHCIAA